MSDPGDRQHPARKRTWNTPEDIAQHQDMTPGERIKKAAALSRETAREARRRGVEFDQILFEQLQRQQKTRG